MSSSAQFWATKHFMTPTAKHQGDLGRAGGNHPATKPENQETQENPEQKNPPTESQRKSESPHEAINNHQSFVESNYHPLRCSSVMNLFWGFSRPQHLVSLCFALGPPKTRFCDCVTRRSQDLGAPPTVLPPHSKLQAPAPATKLPLATFNSECNLGFHLFSVGLFRVLLLPDP